MLHTHTHTHTHMHVQLYELSSGQLLCSLLFDSGLTSVAVDLAAHRLFVGGSTGKIFQVNLFLHVSLQKLRQK